MEESDHAARILALETAFDKEIAGLRREVELRADAQREALRISSAEISRRLDLLNGEAERLRMMQATYISRELAESKFTAMEKQIEDLAVFRSHTLGGRSVIVIIVAAIITLAVGIATGIAVKIFSG